MKENKQVRNKNHKLRRVYFTQEGVVAVIDKEPGYVENNFYTLIGKVHADDNIEAIQHFMGENMLPVFQELNIAYSYLDATMRPTDINVMFLTLQSHADNHIPVELPKKNPDDENEKIKYQGPGPLDSSKPVDLIRYLRDISDITCLFNVTAQPVLNSTLAKEQEEQEQSEESETVGSE